MLSLNYQYKLKVNKQQASTIDEWLEEEKVSLNNSWRLVQSLVTAGLGIVGRYRVGDVYTPKGIPGRSRNQV
jgi:hypothetical protein